MTTDRIESPPSWQRRSIVGRGHGWTRRGVWWELGHREHDQLVLIESGSLRSHMGALSTGTLLVVPSGSRETVTVDSWSITTTDIQLLHRADSSLVPSRSATLSWTRITVEEGAAYTFEGPSTFVLAALSGTVEVTRGDLRTRLMQELLVFDAPALVRAEAIDDADVLAIELAESIRV